MGMAQNVFSNKEEGDPEGGGRLRSTIVPISMDDKATQQCSESDSMRTLTDWVPRTSRTTARIRRSMSRK